MITRATIQAAIRLARRGRRDILAIIDAIAAEYVATQARIERMVMVAIERGDLGTAAKRTKELRAIRSELEALDKRSRLKVRPLLRESYRLGERSVATGTQERKPTPSNLRQNALDILEQNLNNNLGAATQTVGRRVEDIFRREGLRAAQRALYGETESLTRATEAFKARLRREGVTAFTDRSGAMWSLERYARMHIRTVLTESMAMGAEQAMMARDFDLVDIYSGETACSKCDPYVKGSPWSLTGRARGYKVLEKRPHYHPECDCVMLPNAGAYNEREERRAARVS